MARAHDLRPTDPAYRFEEYEAIVNREVAFRQVYEWPNLTNPIVYSNIGNGLNGFQFSYGAAPEQIQVVVQAYAGADAATHDDTIWQKYRLGEALGVKDPETDQPAIRNPWYASPLAAAAVTPPRPTGPTPATATPASRGSSAGASCSSLDTRPFIATPVRRWPMVATPTR